MRASLSVAAIVVCLTAASVHAQILSGSTVETSVPALREAVQKNPASAGLRLRLFQALVLESREDFRAEHMAASMAEKQKLLGEGLKLNPDSIGPLAMPSAESTKGRRS